MTPHTRRNLPVRFPDTGKRETCRQQSTRERGAGSVTDGRVTRRDTNLKLVSTVLFTTVMRNELAA